MTARELPKKFSVAFSFAGEQRDLVRSIAEAVEGTLGLGTVFLDEWFEHYLAGQDADLKLQKIYGEQSELVVVCVSERYGGKPWTLTEHEAIRARVMKARVSREARDMLRILPVRVGEGEVPGIPFDAIVPDLRERATAKSAELILDRLGLILAGPAPEEVSPPPIRSWTKEPVPFSHGLADRTVREWPAVLQLLTAGSPKRILQFKGPSNYSKSALLTAADRYARTLRVSRAYIDFKDTNLLVEANVLRKLQLGLGRALSRALGGRSLGGSSLRPCGRFRGLRSFFLIRTKKPPIRRNLLNGSKFSCSPKLMSAITFALSSVAKKSPISLRLVGETALKLSSWTASRTSASGKTGSMR